MDSSWPQLSHFQILSYSKGETTNSFPSPQLLQMSVLQWVPSSVLSLQRRHLQSKYQPSLIDFRLIREHMDDRRYEVRISSPFFISVTAKVLLPNGASVCHTVLFWGQIRTKNHIESFSWKTTSHLEVCLPIRRFLSGLCGMWSSLKITQIWFCCYIYLCSNVKTMF